MANILCYVEHLAHEPTPSSMETLGQARRLGSALGATVYVAVAMDQAPGYGDDDVLVQLATGGADKILLLVGETFGKPANETTWESHGAALALAWDVCQPALVLIPSTGGGRELAARTAARVGAAFLEDAFVELVDDQLLLAESRGGSSRVLPSELDFPVVATIAPGRYARAAGDEEAEVEVLQASGTARFVCEPSSAGIKPAPLHATLSAPASLIDVPAALAGAVLVKAEGPVMVELATSHGPLAIALGDDAASCERAEFAIEGVAQDLLLALFSAGRS